MNKEPTKSPLPRIEIDQGADYFDQNDTQIGAILVIQDKPWTAYTMNQADWDSALSFVEKCREHAQVLGWPLVISETVKGYLELEE